MVGWGSFYYYYFYRFQAISSIIISFSCCWNTTKYYSNPYCRSTIATTLLVACCCSSYWLLVVVVVEEVETTNSLIVAITYQVPTIIMGCITTYVCHRCRRVYGFMYPPEKFFRKSERNSQLLRILVVAKMISHYTYNVYGGISRFSMLLWKLRIMHLGQ